MEVKNIENIIISFIEGRLNEDEVLELKAFLEKKENRAYFEDYVELNYLINSQNKFDYKKPFQKFESKFLKKSKFSKRSFLKYAAAILLFVSVGYFYISKSFNKTENNIVIENTIEIGSNKAVLTLENGEKVDLDEVNTFTNSNVVNKEDQLVYSKTNDKIEEVAYNYLTVPRGGQYTVKLADGTQVWLNSETQLKYPVKFIDKHPRLVDLVYGEAYFKVTSSDKNEGAKFIVKTQTQDVEVVGTEFNIKAYKDDGILYTTLVEGKVVVENKNNTVILKPGQQSRIVSFNEESSITVVSVDVESEISWKKGVFSFKDKPLKDIVKVLSRWYDVDIEITDKKMENVRFKGVLNKNQNIEEILLIIKTMKSINNYEIKKGKITIK